MRYRIGFRSDSRPAERARFMRCIANDPEAPVVLTVDTDDTVSATQADAILGYDRAIARALNIECQVEATPASDPPGEWWATYGAIIQHNVARDSAW